MSKLNCIEALEARRLFTVFTVTSNADSGAGTLREAITLANINAGLDEIRFNLPAGQTKIAPLTSLPTITGATKIDGSTQPGFTNKPIVEVSGDSLTSGVRTRNGLYFDQGSTGSTVKGLVINSFSTGIFFITGSNTVVGNYIGTDVTGLLAKGNNSGVRAGGGNTTIGGPTAADRNVVSGNTTYGIELSGPSDATNLIQGNYIGVNAAGTAALKNVIGINATAGGFIGGISGIPDSWNIIAGNSQDGIATSGNPFLPLTIQYNRIGVGATGGALGNSRHGIRLNTQASGRYIIKNNEIANNTSNGISQPGSSAETNPRSLILENSIYNNGGQGIDLGFAGATGIDAGDSDFGPNNLLNYPSIDRVMGTLANPIVEGRYSGPANTTAILSFYRNDAADDTLYGEGKTFAGSVTVTTNASGAATFSFPLTVSLAAGNTVAATASVMDASGGTGITSEFSQYMLIGAGGQIRGFVFDDVDGDAFPDSGENMLVSGRTVWLDQNNNAIQDTGEQSFTTQVDGFWFTNLPAGRYYVRQHVPAGSRQTSPDPLTSPAYIVDLGWGQGRQLYFGTQLIGYAATAVPGGPYTVQEGQSITLNGSASFANVGSITGYSWDFDYDGSFQSNATGATPTFSAAAISGPLTRTIALRVTSSMGATDTMIATVNITNRTPTATFAAVTPTITVGQTATVAFTNASDAPADITRGLYYNYYLGSYAGEFWDTPQFTFPAQLLTVGTHTIRGRVYDRDGAFTEYTTTVTVNPAAPATPPAAPSGIAGTVVSGNRIDVRWTDNANNETGFEIQRSAVYNFLNPTNVTVNTPNLSSYSDTTLTPNTYYYFRVRALNSAGASGWSGSVKLKTSSSGTVPTVPAMPTSPGATAISSSQITVTWGDASNNETGFRIQRASNSGFTTGLTTFTVGAGVTSFVNTGLAAGTTYYYRVQSYNGTGPSAYTAGVSATTQSVTPTVPNAPTNPAAAANSSSQITVVWADNSNNETGFRIRRRVGVEIDPFVSYVDFTVGAGVTSFIDSGLTPSSTYTYFVQAYNAAGSSAFTNAVSTMTESAPTPPAMPTSPTATANSSSQITVNWTDASHNESGFRIQRSTNSTFTAGLTTFTVGAGVTSFVNTGLTASTTYYYRVQSYNADGPSAYTAGVNATTQAAPGGTGPLTAPSGLAGTVGRTNVLLNWLDNSNNESGWEIQISTVYNFTPETSRIVTVSGSNLTSFNVTGLNSYTWYYFRIRSVNSTNVSSWSGSIKLKTLA